MLANMKHGPPSSQCWIFCHRTHPRNRTTPVVLESVCPPFCPPAGNSPVVVCPDADLQAAVEGAHFALYFNM